MIDLHKFTMAEEEEKSIFDQSEEIQPMSTKRDLTGENNLKSDPDFNQMKDFTDMIKAGKT